MWEAKNGKKFSRRHILFDQKAELYQKQKKYNEECRARWVEQTLSQQQAEANQQEQEQQEKQEKQQNEQDQPAEKQQLRTQEM